ncbi:MAG: hypothetical protein ACRELY_32490 [Polyangiaceae bacterium]
MARGVGRRRWIAGIVMVLVAASGAAAGCALDDTAITQVVPGDDASLFDAGANEASSDGPSSDGPSCVAKTCDNFPSDCHPALSDGCGKTIDCTNACPSGQACVADGGTGVGFFCNGPPVCNDAGEPGNSCGVLTNPGNGLQTNCGGCDAGNACTSSTCGCAGTTCTGSELCCQSASGTPSCNDNNTACCARRGCSSDRTQCSPTYSNNCGGTLNCQVPSNCIGGQVCDTTNSQCCTVTTTCGTNCNTDITTNCNTSLHCGACSTGACLGTTCCLTLTCGGVCCSPLQTECNGTICCTPDPLGTTCGGKCGTTNDNCGVATNCGNCADGDDCFGTTCTCGSTTCNAGQKCHRSPDHCTP